MKAILLVLAAAAAAAPIINASVFGYPDCIVTYSTWIGNSICDGSEYNTTECGFDGGDCIVAGYPDCIVTYPAWIGDDICNNYDGYNTAACGFDGGDCDSETGVNVIAIVGIIAGIAVTLLSLKQGLRNAGNHPGGPPASTGATAPNAPPPSAPQSEEEKREQRRFLILTSIIHKKVLSTTTKHGEHDGDDADDEEEEILVLPHEESLSLRQSNASSASSENKEEPSSLFSQIAANTDEETGGGIMNKKDDVYVASLRSVRDSMGISVRDVGVDEDSLYSPRCCPICCEDYQKGDAIAWSRNEECHHAFHVDCVLQWLMDNDDCPMCRAQYIDLDAQ